MGEVKKRICLCKDCGRLDYAAGRCEKCGSTNIASASHDFMVGYGRDIFEIQYLSQQNPFLKKEIAQ